MVEALNHSVWPLAVRPSTSRVSTSSSGSPRDLDGHDSSQTALPQRSRQRKISWQGRIRASAAATIILVWVTMAALRERYYSAVMAATGLLYLAILTGFGTDLVGRAVLAG